LLHVSYTLNAENNLIVFHSFQHSGSFLSNHVYATTEYGYKIFHRNFFETSHAKGPQDAAGGFIKRQADIAVLRGNTIIQNSKDCFHFVTMT
jgi:hypothetical protein